MTRHETLFLLTCALRVAEAFSHRSKIAGELSDWLERYPLGIEWSPDTGSYGAVQISRQDWMALRERLGRAVASSDRARPDAVARNCAELGRYLRLGPVEADILLLSARVGQGGPLASLVDALVDDARLPVDQAVARLTGHTASSVQRAMSPAGRLMTSGLIAREVGRHSHHGLAPSDRLSRALQPPTRGLRDILNALFASPVHPSATWEDFEHLGEGRDFAVRLLRGALRRRKAEGVNVLLYGPPGTGKTEFCRVIARHLGARLFAAGETDDDGDEPSRRERQMQLRLGQRLLAGRKDALVLFDEMEDLFATDWSFPFSAARRGGSKVHLHRLLETNPVPTLWTTNSIERVDPAILRRVTFSLELRPPPQRVRARIWDRLSARHRMDLDEDTREQLARETADAPALADTALRAAKLAGGRRSDLRLAVQASAKAVRGGRAPVPVPGLETAFDLDLTRADTDLNALLRRLSDPAAPRAVSFCLFGPPGTGKSAFARHLAKKMGLPVVQKRASDLLGMFVGETEARIADAFAEARTEGAFLIFDEADSLLSTREGAHRNWEISQVNEMLTWMESHPQPFACTTNMADRLDPAALRRFTFRARFLPLTEAQRIAAFRRFFGVAPPHGLEAIDLVTPGDFAVVAKRARLLGIRNPDKLVAELVREQQAKPEARVPVGFRHG